MLRSSNFDNSHQDPYERSSLKSPRDSVERLMFFYGTLTLPHILGRVLALESAPTLTEASITGYEIKRWGPYPALVASRDAKVQGKVCKIWTEDQLEALQRYETRNYKPERCKISVNGVEEPVEGWTFVWDGHLYQLTEGPWDASPFATR